MKRRLLLIITAAMLLAGCDEPVESAPETVEQTTAAQTTTASSAAQTTSAQTADDPVSSVTSAEAEQTVVGGVSLTDDHKELRESFSGADEYCDYIELGITTTMCDDFVARAYQLAEQSEGFDSSYNDKHLSRCIGVDDGCFYFSVVYTYQHYVEEAEWWDTTYKDIYFCYDCDTDELTQIFALDAYPEIEAVSNEVMVLRDNNYNYVALHRESGYLAELPAPSTNIVLIDDTVYYQFLYLESNAVPVGQTGSDLIYIDDYTVESGIVRVGWMLMEENRYSRSSAGVFDQSTTDTIGMIDYPDYEELLGYNYLSTRYSISRGVYNIVCLHNDNVAYALNNKDYLVHDPGGRVKDLIYDTYYQGTVMAEENLLGCRLRFSITDRNGEEYVLGYSQSRSKYSENPYFIYEVKMHSTQDGLVFLDTGKALLALIAEPDNMSYVKAALLPEDIFSQEMEWEYNVYCDDDRIYLFDKSAEKIVTIHR
ncbi:MAG: hypothetical protein E7478_06365 [Ruminococcaceae bacterium]|nr:hypothetical protein [Oscillospiraceae bacterium]